MTAHELGCDMLDHSKLCLKTHIVGLFHHEQGLSKYLFILCVSQMKSRPGYRIGVHANVGFKDEAFLACGVKGLPLFSKAPWQRICLQNGAAHFPEYGHQRGLKNIVTDLVAILPATMYSGTH